MQGLTFWGPDRRGVTLVTFQGVKLGHIEQDGPVARCTVRVGADHTLLVGPLAEVQAHMAAIVTTSLSWADGGLFELGGDRPVKGTLGELCRSLASCPPCAPGRVPVTLPDGRTLRVTQPPPINRRLSMAWLQAIEESYRLRA